MTHSLAQLYITKSQSQMITNLTQRYLEEKEKVQMLLEACKEASRCLQDPTEEDSNKLETMLTNAISKATGETL